MRGRQPKGTNMSFTRKTLALTLMTLALGGLALTSSALAQVGPPGGTIFAHGVAYQTVATPTQLPASGQFDTIYALGGGLASVSESAPGDADYNGGRWEVRLVSWLTIEPTQFTSAEEVLDAAAMGQIEISDVVTRFVCPLIPQ
jgi:hypothetical protein